jgi:two-component sensor histidine kinase
MSNLAMILLLTLFTRILLLPDSVMQQRTINEADPNLKQSQFLSPVTEKERLPLNINKLDQSKIPVNDPDNLRKKASKSPDFILLQQLGVGINTPLYPNDKSYIQPPSTLKTQRNTSPETLLNQANLYLQLGKKMLKTPYAQPNDMYSALEYFYDAERLSRKIGDLMLIEESLGLIGVVHLITGDWERGKSYFMQVAESRSQTGDKKGEIFALLKLAITVVCDRCEENIEVIKHALSLSEEIRDPALEALIRIQLGYKYLSAGIIGLAEDEALRALEIQNRIGFAETCRIYREFSIQSVYNSPKDYAYLSSAYYLLSDIGQSNGHLNQKLYYILKVMEDVEKNEMFEELDYTLSRLGNAYWELGEYDKSMVYHQKSAELSLQNGDFISVGLISRMSRALISQGKAKEALVLIQDVLDRKPLCTLEEKMFIAQSLGTCYNSLNQFSLAEKFYLESIVWSKKSSMFHRYLAYRGIANFYVSNGKYSDAEPYLTFLENASPQQLLPNYQIEVHLMRFKLDSSRQNYPEAIRHYQLYKTLQDSIFNETKNRQISQLSIEYETAKKEQDIQIKEMEIELLREQNNRQQNHRNALVTGAGLLVALLALGFNRYRLKQRSNRQLLAQQQILQLQKKQISQKNEHLAMVVNEKDLVLAQKDYLIKEKDQLLNEKGWLLREIHHRVKNNFHMVASLLEIQSSYLKNKAALSAVKDSQRRIHSMSIIHQKLYQSDSLSTIYMPEYIYELVEFLKDSYGVKKEIGFSLEIDNIALDHGIAVTLGLILNEAITNALKYAFVKTGPGMITISLKHVTETQIVLTVKDNGDGLPRNFQKKLGASMGMELLKGLSDDIGGNLRIENIEGTSITITFQNKGENVNNVYIS